MAAPPLQTKQTNLVKNEARGLIFFEEDNLCYNYKTNQWTEITGWGSVGMFSVDNASADIGLVIYSSGSVALQTQTTSYPQQTATIVTGESNLNGFGRAVVDGVRPIVNGASTISVRVGVRDTISDSVTWSTGTSLNSRSNMSHFRGGANPPEGRYHRFEYTITDFTTALGTDIEFRNAGKV